VLYVYAVLPSLSRTVQQVKWKNSVAEKKKTGPLLVILFGSI
jgi:hypothetical protein